MKKYLIWYIKNNQHIFELVNYIDKPFLYKWLINKEGFTINMIGNILELWMNDTKAFFEGEKMNRDFTWSEPVSVKEVVCGVLEGSADEAKEIVSEIDETVELLSYFFRSF